MDHVDRTSARMRASRLLSAADVEPPSVPPSSILIVRTLADPARGELLRDGEASVAPPRWVSAARDRLAELYRRASRPALGPTSASTDSVVFRDHAELLACLARDALSGNIAACWWWQAWARAAHFATLDDVLREWCRAASYAPAAFAILQDRRLAVIFAGELSPRQARTLFVAITEAYEIPALAGPIPAHVVDPVAPETVDVGAPALQRAHAVGEPRRAAAATSRAGIPPWEPHVLSSPVPAALGLEQRTLLGVALALERMPLAVRTRRFQHAFHAWRREEQFRRTAMSDASMRTVDSKRMAPIGGPSDERVLAQHELPDPFDAVRAASEAPGTNRRASTTIEDGSTAAPKRERSDDARATVASREESGQASAQASPAPESPIPGWTSRSTVEAEGPSRAWPDDASRAPGAISAETSSLELDSAQVRTSNAFEARTVQQLEAIHTELGGVLFLINALRHLELFDRLDDHFGVTNAIGGWGWLEILARALLGPERATAAADPLWHALAGLDGREGPLDLAVFTRPRTYALPVEWPFDRAHDGAQGGPFDRAHDGTQSRIAPRGTTHLLGQQLPRTLRRFLDVLVPYLRWRLLESMALGTPAPDEAGARLASRLLCKRGRLTCTGTHVDLHMGMSQVDIAVRMAGLDANPGWVPALGRVVTFYFEQEIV